MQSVVSGARTAVADAASTERQRIAALANSLLSQSAGQRTPAAALAGTGCRSSL